MKKNIIMSFSTLSIISMLLWSCKDDKVNPAATSGSFKLEFDNVSGTVDFAFDKEYVNKHGEKYKVNLLRYYISNIQLKKKDGSWYVYPQDQSYFLVDEAKPKEIELNNVPFDSYTAVKFIIGVDSLRSTMDVSKRTGVLSPDIGMYWSWNSGYIFFMMEGTSSSVVTTTTGHGSTTSGHNTTTTSTGHSHQHRLSSGEGVFRYHIGGFGGYNSKTINNLQTVELAFSDDVSVSESNVPTLHILADISKVFYGVHDIKLSVHSNVMFSEPSLKISANYAKMFSLDHVHNNPPVKNGNGHSH